MKNMMKKISSFSFAAAVVMLLAVSARAADAVPSMINYQGRLTDDKNNPVTKTAGIKFEIFDNLQGTGSPLWSETHPAVQVVNGVFSAQLGSKGKAITQTVLSSNQGYLKVTVDGEPLSPLQRLLSSPYAVQSSSAANSVMLGGISASLYALKSDIPVGGNTQWIGTAGGPISYSGGNVGIGTANPGIYQLNVNGDINFTGTLRQNGTPFSGNGVSAHAATHITNGNDIIANAAAGTSSGLMSASDKTKLDALPGSLNLGSLATLSAVSGGTNGTITDGTITNADLASGSFPKITGLGTLGSLTVGSLTQGDNADYVIDVLRHGTALSPGTWTSGSPAMRIFDMSGDGPASFDSRALFEVTAGKIASTDPNAANALVFNARNDDMSCILCVNANGNVGVGMNSGQPTSRLEVSGDVRIKNGSGGVLYFADGTSMATAGSGSASSLSAAGDGIMTADSDANVSGDIILKTGSNDRLHILNNGNVGIGTANPGTNKLQVQGDELVTGNLTVNGTITGSVTGSAGSVAWANVSGKPTVLSAFTNDSNFITSAQAPVQTVAGRSGAVVLAQADISGLTTAASPTFAGTTITGGANLATVSGNVGVGTSGPSAKLDVSGQIRSSDAGTTKANAVAAIDWNNGNLQTTSVDCQAMTFTNMLDGGSYTLVVTGSGSGTCSFSQSGLTFKSVPALSATTASSHSVFTFLRAGNNVYVSWITGF